MITKLGWGLPGKACVKILGEEQGFHCFYLFLFIPPFIECLLYTRHCSGS